MTRTLKTLGIALFAILALGVTASSAMAAEHVFTSVNNEETVTGTGENHLFELTESGLGVECTTAQFHGTVNNGSGEATVTPHYTGTPGKTHDGHCDSDLGTADVTMNGCGYVLTGKTDANGHGDAWVECPKDQSIVIHITEFGTTLTIHSQTPHEGGVTYTQNGDHVDIDATVGGITYTCAPAFLCGLAGISAEGEDGEYAGTTTVHGARGKISVSGR